MKMELDKNHPFYKKINVIEQSAYRAAELTRQLLGFAKGGKYKIENLNLNDIVKNVYNMIQETFEKRISITLNLEPELYYIEGDAGQLEQVLLNLCINARDAIPGKGNIYIDTLNTRFLKPYSDHLFSISPGYYTLLQISDDGTGMSDEVQRKIFEPFFSTKEDGTGMGLAMVYGIVKSHNGLIKVYSEKGKGTIFKLFFPKSKKSEKKKKEKPEKKLHPAKGREKILLIENEKEVVEVVKVFLEELGYKVFTASNKKEVLKLFRENKIELVILDIIIPESEGKEIFYELKKLNPDVKILLTSSYSINDEIQEILNSGAKGFIQKPYIFDQLTKTIRETLD